MPRCIRRKIAVILCLSMLFCLGGCAGAGRPVRCQRTALDYFDTVITLTGYAQSREEFDRKTQPVMDLLREYHELCDIYHPYDGVKNLYTLNRTAFTAPVSVDERLFSLLKQALTVAKETDEQFSPTLGSVLVLWHDCREAASENPQNAELPQEEALQAAAGHCAREALVLDEAAHTVYFADPALRLELGAFAKGYAAEEAAALAKQQGLDSLMLNVGGLIRTVGTKPDGSRWSVGLENPRKPEEFLRTLSLPAGAALSTSGDYQRYFTVDGVRYSHIIDPDTLYPPTAFQSVTVLCRNAGDADAFSTALFCMELSAGQKFVSSQKDSEALWVLSDGTVRVSEGWERAVSA